MADGDLYTSVTLTFNDGSKAYYASNDNRHKRFSVREVSGRLLVVKQVWDSIGGGWKPQSADEYVSSDVKSRAYTS